LQRGTLGKDPRCPRARVVAPPAHDGGVVIARQRDGVALLGVSPLLRVKTHTAPAPAAPGTPLSLSPPTLAVLPSADSATEKPWSAFPTAPVPTSFGPCCVNCASASSGKTSSAEKHTSAATKIGHLRENSDAIDANMTSPPSSSETTARRSAIGASAGTMVQGSCRCWENTSSALRGEWQRDLEHLTRRLNRLWVHMTARIGFNIPTGTKGPVMNGEALF
jgi:hypothetical protein